MNRGNLVAPPERHQDRCRYIIRFVPSLNLAALKARPREDKQLMLWYCLRSLDTTGRGVLVQDDAIEALEAEYGYARKTVYKHLAVGDGLYWRLHFSTRRGRFYIVLFSLAKVAVHLGAGLSRCEHFIKVPVAELPPSGHTQARRALLYNSGAYKPFVVHTDHPISRQSLLDKTGVQERQQRRFDVIMEAKGRPIREETMAFFREPGTYRIKSHQRLIEKKFSEVLTRQLPNRYRTWYEGGPRGMLPKVASELNGGTKSFKRGEATCTKGRQPRRYYSSFSTYRKSTLRGMTSDRDTYYYPCRANSSKYIVGVIW